jgi:putative NADH-flavin reductase
MRDRIVRIVVFGANGGTGRLLTQQALDAGHEVAAVTRNPSSFPISASRLRVAEADVHDRTTTTDVLGGADVVLSALGVPFSRQPITIYSDGIASITEAMEKNGVKRVAVVSSAGSEPTRHADGGFLLNRVMQPLVTATIGKTTYADMRAMEAHLRAGSLDWTVLRPGGLFDAGSVSGYELRESHSDRVFTSRADLAASLLAQASSSAWVRRCVAVNTVTGVPSLLQMIRHEAFGDH